MSWLSRSILLAGLLAGGASLAPAHAAPVSGGLMLAGPSAATSSDLLQEVRYVNRCRPVTTFRRDRMGRPMRVTREVCRRVWVGRGRY
ncbi:hypothetical protein [Roseomonas indoligenes]|uniref:UrcA family protein n=1 Tax=Roseomonas indoligenes TaxID=2820811 RepID=A0A940MW86_9PROT|nr:hypothetical protein [Pararoseomonas indoligenes]MBP0491641.1 hypothetical protein [Pararoseomonas indoligenes]